MKIDFYIYKVRSEFAIEVGTRYIVQAHRFGTPQSKWTCAESLVELHYIMGQHHLPAFEWGVIEEKLEAQGGFEIDLDLEEFTFHQLFLNS